MHSRGSGILLHISSLPSSHGIGDLGSEAYKFADKLHQASQSYWQVLPLNPTNPGSFNSPYFSPSAIGGNPLLISLERLVEQGYIDNSLFYEHQLPKHEVDYPAVVRYKLPILNSAYANFTKKTSRTRFDAFCKKQAGWLDDFALFMALKQKYDGAKWHVWPKEIEFRHKQTLDTITQECAEQIDREKWYQFIFFEQWQELKHYCNNRNIQIIGDIPIYVSYDSVDVWSKTTLFKLNTNLRPTFVSGVPPDYFSATGQLWNNPVYNWDAMKADGYSWWIHRMKVMFERFDIVRIDHFRGLVQFWEVPAGEKTAINGAWQPVPTYDFFDTLTKLLPGFPVIAEDLGIITDDVREAMDRYNFPGMKVLLFAFGEDNPFHPYLPHMYDRNCIVYTGTHDNNTARGWFEKEASDEDRERVYRYTSAERTAESVVATLIRTAQSSVANTAIIPLQDLLMLGMDCRMNQPAVTEGNWKWRCLPEQMERFPTEWLADMARCYGRVPKEKE